MIGIARYEGGHLEILGKKGNVFSDGSAVDRLVPADDGESVYDALSAVNA